MEQTQHKIVSIANNLVPLKVLQWSDTAEVEQILRERLVDLNRAIQFHRENEGMLELLERTFDLNVKLLKIIKER